MIFVLLFICLVVYEGGLLVSIVLCIFIVYIVNYIFNSFVVFFIFILNRYIVLYYIIDLIGYFVEFKNM